MGTSAPAGSGHPPKNETPFSCDLKALTPAERAEQHQLGERLAQAVIKTAETTDGYSFELNRNAISLRDLAEWIEYERRCCPFFDFKLELGREGGPVTLRLGGREGINAFIRAEFPRIVQ